MNKDKIPKTISTDYEIRPINFSGWLFSLNGELTCEKVLEEFKEFVKENNYIGGLDHLHDPKHDTNIYPISKAPKHLYHYTNINTLALILKNKTIMLNNLSNVDDLNEGKTKDFETLGKYCFASCWTDNPEESIPFWNMYTEGLRGVRIRLRSNPFTLNIIDTKFLSDNWDQKEDIKIEGGLNSIYAQNLLINDKFSIVPPYDNNLKKIIYTNDENLLYPKLHKVLTDGEILRLGELGQYKRGEWAFQREWRYIVIAIPIGIREFLDEKCFSKAKKGFIDKNDIGINNIFLEIEDKAFKGMEIVLGPMADEGEKLIVESLVNQYNPSAILRESILKEQVNIR